MSTGSKTRLEDGSEPDRGSGSSQPTRLEPDAEADPGGGTRPLPRHPDPPPPRVGRATRLEAPPDPPRAARRQTRLQGAPEPPPGTAQPTREETAPPAPGHAAGDPRATRLESTATRVDRRQTVLQGSYPAEPEARADDRALVAVLAAPGIGPGGAVFAVRAGKNAIGADPASDVCLHADSEVSGEHALLLCRKNGFFLADRMSTNGTWVNGEEIDVTGAVALADRDVIRVGNTLLQFLVLDLGDSAPPAEA